MDRETEHECRVYIAVAEACHRKVEPSHSMHVLEWLITKQRRRLPLTWGGPLYTLTTPY